MIERAVAMHEQVREDKRAEQFHRRRARQRMAELQAFCEQVGLDFEVVKKGRTKSNGQGPEEEETQHPGTIA